MNNHKIHIILCLVILAAALLATNWDRLLNVVFLGTSTPTVERVHGPHLLLSPSEYDLGIVKQSGGLVSRTFDVFNNGSEDVNIDEDTDQSIFKGYEDELEWCPVLHGGVQYYAYVEVRQAIGTMSRLWAVIGELMKEFPHLATAHISDARDIYPVFRKLFEKERSVA